jgi:hypothetical protein
MTPLESFTRLAAVGVSVERLERDHIGFFRDSPVGPVLIPDTHATALLCNAVLEKWPYLCVRQRRSGPWLVQDWEQGSPIVMEAPTRLAALTLAAEAKHKENGDD